MAVTWDLPQLSPSEMIAVLSAAETAVLINREAARIFRISHVSNVEWLLQNGLCSRGSGRVDPHHISIGNADLIQKRATRLVEVHPGGSLDDYVPFYFTPFSPMAYNIKTGFNGIKKLPNNHLVFLTTSVHRLAMSSLPFLFTDSHAYLKTAKYFAQISSLKWVDWKILQGRDFRRDMNDLGKLDRYQAECLVYQRCPISAVEEVACFTDNAASNIARLAARQGIQVQVAARPGWYF